MSRKLAAVVVGLSVAVLASPVLAGGGERIPAPIPVPAPMPIQESFSHYLRGDIGWGFAGEPSYSESGADSGPLSTGRGVDTSDVFHGSIGAGTYWTSRFRTDVTIDFRGTQSVDAVTTYNDGGTLGTARDRVELRGTVGMFNAYWDLMPRGSFTPYIGAGVGFVYNQIDRRYTAIEDVSLAVDQQGSGSSNNVGLAAALMAGVSVSWSQTWVLDIGYRALFMDGGDVVTPLIGGVSTSSRIEIGSQWEHQLRVGLRANLW
jgi:opacity protein-like surface antigen